MKRLAAPIAAFAVFYAAARLDGLDLPRVREWFMSIAPVGNVIAANLLFLGCIVLAVSLFVDVDD